jgi:hypothetical protein
MVIGIGIGIGIGVYWKGNRERNGDSLACLAPNTTTCCDNPKMYSRMQKVAMEVAVIII